MTNTERKKKQYQLQALKARKAKADALGPEVIARTRAKYDGICAEIRQLETELAADLGGPLTELTQVIHEALAWDWPKGDEDLWERAVRVCPSVTHDIDDLEAGMTAAYNSGEHRRLHDLVPQYRKALQKMYEAVSAPPRQSNLMDMFEEVTVDVPW